MKAESWIIVSIAIFCALVAPIYWWITYDWTGTTALVMTTLLCTLLGFYLIVVARQIPARPEDRLDAEIVEGAGELGFFPPYSWWPLYCSLAFTAIVLGVVIGWWLFIIGAAIGLFTLIGWIYEYYRGVHAH
ncbi:MAG TPA: cytochrome c oxidase subunit 4 [Aeromicrobium sp.]|nr:cytochrome c oxidase subunit 4 [Aeromicrobium sp.]